MVASLNRKPVVNAILQGLLSQSMEDVNAVNATLLAKERGIEVGEVARDSSDHFNTLLRVVVHDGGDERSVSGTVFDGVRPRIVSIDTCEVEMAPEGRLLFMQNRDRPGVIAAVGTVLAGASINIGDFRLGRREDREYAVSLVSVDSEPDDAIIAALAALPNMETVRYLNLEPM